MHSNGSNWYEYEILIPEYTYELKRKFFIIKLRENRKNNCVHQHYFGGAKASEMEFVTKWHA